MAAPPEPGPERPSWWPKPASESVTRAMLGNTWRDTKPEVAVRSILHRRGHRFRKRLTIRLGDGRWTQPDIAFTSKRLAVFIDGCFWHRCPLHGTEPRANSQYWKPKLDRNVRRDRDTDARLEGLGWSVLRAWEHEAPEEIAGRVESALADLPT